MFFLQEFIKFPYDFTHQLFKVKFYSKAINSLVTRNVVIANELSEDQIVSGLTRTFQDLDKLELQLSEQELMFCFGEVTSNYRTPDTDLKLFDSIWLDATHFGIEVASENRRLCLYFTAIFEYEVTEQQVTTHFKKLFNNAFSIKVDELDTCWVLNTK